jgi:hypothetical protein
MVVLVLALTNAGGAVSDIWNARERGLASAIYATAPFLGPVGLLLQIPASLSFSETASVQLVRSLGASLLRTHASDGISISVSC